MFAFQNYNTYLRRLFLSKREDAEEDKVEFHFDCAALLDDDVDFPDLPLRDRVLIMQQVHFTTFYFCVKTYTLKSMEEHDMYFGKFREFLGLEIIFWVLLN